MNPQNEFELDRTIRDFEFTKKARKQIRQVVTSDSFLDLSCEEIMLLLRDKMEQVAFRDYLKRYLYQRADLHESFRSVPDKTWQQMIEYSFEENNAPHSFERTSTRWNATVKSWLTAQRVRRSTVFLLGFGLAMSDDDVSEMLTKVLMEDDFRQDDPTEVIYQYCFHRGLPYSHAYALLQQCELVPEEDAPPRNQPPENEEQLLSRVSYLKGNSDHNSALRNRTHCFKELYRRCCTVIAGIYNQDEQEKPPNERRSWTADDITPADLEHMLCCGIPTTASGNLVKASMSALCHQFDSFRPSRQHMEGILHDQLYPDRYDLLTLSFFLHAQQDIPGRERLNHYLDETNRILASCNMGGVYPVHAYEAFLLICIVSDCPMAVYAEIWEMSFE